MGFTGVETLNVLSQIGLALAGAAALWGWLFSWKAKSLSGGEQFAHRQIAGRLLVPLFFGVLIFLVSALLYYGTGPIEALSHEGISIPLQVQEIDAALALKMPLIVALSIVTAVLLLLWRKKTHSASVFLSPLLFLEFLIISVLISLPAWTGELGGEQSFYLGHSWHSILTVGTVLVIDYLFHYAHKREALRAALYPHFHTMSKAIWLGLGIEFLSVAFIYSDAIAFTERFMFMQIVVSIIIINGALLSGPIVGRLQKLMGESGVGLLRGSWDKIAGASGVLSIVSWLSITIIDGYHGLTFTLGQYLFGYVIALFFAYITYRILERHPVVGV